MSAPDPGETFARNAAPRTELAEALKVGMRKAVTETQLTWALPYKREHWWTLRRRTWWIARTAPGEEPVRVAGGRHLTARGAARAWERAYGAELDRGASNAERIPGAES